MADIKKLLGELDGVKSETRRNEIKSEIMAEFSGLGELQGECNDLITTLGVEKNRLMDALKLDDGDPLLPCAGLGLNVASCPAVVHYQKTKEALEK